MAWKGLALKEWVQNNFNNYTDNEARTAVNGSSVSITGSAGSLSGNNVTTVNGETGNVTVDGPGWKFPMLDPLRNSWEDYSVNSAQKCLNYRTDDSFDPRNDDPLYISTPETTQFRAKIEENPNGNWTMINFQTEGGQYGGGEYTVSGQGADTWVYWTFDQPVTYFRMDLDNNIRKEIYTLQAKY